MIPFVPRELPLAEVQWEPLIKSIGDARAALAHYDGVLHGVPNTSLLLTPLTTREALLSSKIEGTIATMGEVYRFEAGETPERQTRKDEMQEIINYRRALRYAERVLDKKPFHLNLLLALHKMLMDSVRGRDKSPGSFRRTQNYIGRPGRPIEEADFVPPEPRHMMPLLDNWEKYYHSERPDPLVQLAIIHAQFEIIHPFNDGNGRIGRIIIPIFLYEKSLIRSPMFYLSEYLERHRDEYISRLRALGRSAGAWNEWIGFFLNAVREQSVINSAKAREILNLYARMKTRVLDLTHSQFAIPILDRMFEQPIFYSTQVIFPDGEGPSRQSISVILNKLTKAGILSVVVKGRGSRPKILEFSELVRLSESDVAPH